MVPISVNGMSVDAFLDKADQFTVLSADFVNFHLPSLQLSGICDLNGIKTGEQLTATLSKELVIGLGD